MGLGARAAIAGLLLAALARPALAAGEAAGGSPFRYDDDPAVFANAPPDDLYAHLKYIGLGNGPFGGTDYLFFGADLRERVEASDLALLGFRYPAADAYDLHRLLVFADLQLGPDVRAFVQLGDHDEVGRQPAALPTDVDRLDLSQAFLDVGWAVGQGPAIILRLGRAEMSFDDGAIVGLRDGPNVRQVWDGARLSYVIGTWRWDAFVVDPVAVNPGLFDDRAFVGQVLEGVHVTVAPSSEVAADAFYFHNRNPSVSLYEAAGLEDTDTLGLRVRASIPPFDGSIGAIGQTGSADARPVRAFALHTDFGWTASAGDLTSRLGLRADVLSGGDPKAAHVATFNALYPNVAYSTEATIEAPANLVQVGLIASVRPKHNFTLQYTVEGLWRYSVRDAFYAAPLFPLVRPDPANNSRFAGVEQQLRAVFSLSPIVTLTAAFVRFSAGRFVSQGGGGDESFGMTEIAFRL